MRHAFSDDSPTMRAVAAGFSEIRPKLLIVEGFPTIMGEDPPPLVQEAHHHGARDADDYARGEAMFAASLALKQAVPFVGGEPDRAEQIDALKAKGFTDADIAFNAMAGEFSQALRSGDMPDTSAASLLKAYPRLAERLVAPLDRGGWVQTAPSLDAFRQRYRELYGVDISGDRQFPLRIDVVYDKTRNGELQRAAGIIRDRHLLGLIEQQLSEKRAVLVVYGSSHWSTVSAALEQRLGKPDVRPFLK